MCDRCTSDHGAHMRWAEGQSRVGRVATTLQRLLRFIAGGIFPVEMSLPNWGFIQQGAVGEVDLVDILRSPVVTAGALLLVYAALGYPFNRTHPGRQFSRGGSLEGAPGSAGARASGAAWATPPGAAWWR